LVYFFVLHGLQLEGLARHALVEFDISAGYGLHPGVIHNRHLLPSLAHEIVGDQPFADKLLAQLLLLFPRLLPLLKSLGVEIAGRIGRMDFVDQINGVANLAEFVKTFATILWLKQSIHCYRFLY
jgi:hypothetical protein